MLGGDWEGRVGSQGVHRCNQKKVGSHTEEFSPDFRILPGPVSSVPVLPQLLCPGPAEGEQGTEGGALGPQRPGSFTHRQAFLEHLLHTRHCSRLWGCGREQNRAPGGRDILTEALRYIFLAYCTTPGKSPASLEGDRADLPPDSPRQTAARVSGPTLLPPAPWAHQAEGKICLLPLPISPGSRLWQAPRNDRGQVPSRHSSSVFSAVQ